MKKLWKFLPASSIVKSFAMRISGFQKFVACILAAFVCGATFLRIGRRFLGWISPQIIIGITICILITALVAAFSWAIQKKQDNNKAINTLAFWQGAIRYGIAIDLILLGLQKIFGLQFSMPLAMLDLPFSSMSGEDLTFAYFAHSYSYVVILGIFQIAGSVLLLFGRTRLTGIFTLLPVMLNIVFINACYKMETGELAHSSILLAALVYLLFADYERLKEFFFRAKNTIPAVDFKNKPVKNGIRLSAIAIPLLLVTLYKFPERHPALYGKYHVNNLFVNGQEVAPASCKDSALTTVYFDQNADCVFEYNNQSKRLIGNYHFDESANKMTVEWRYPVTVHDTLFVSISDFRPNTRMTLTGRMGNQPLQIELLAEKK